MTTCSLTTHYAVARHLRVSAHAVERFQSRVYPTSSAAACRLLLERMVSCGKTRSRPRHWMRQIEPAPGLRFLYWVELPHVCGLVVNGVVVTVLTRALCRPVKTYDRSYDRNYERDRTTSRQQRVARQTRLRELERRAK